MLFLPARACAGLLPLHGGVRGGVYTGGIRMKKMIGLMVIMSMLLCACASASENADLAARLYLTTPVEMKLDEAKATIDAAGYISYNVRNIEEMGELLMVEKPREMINIALGVSKDTFADTDAIKNIKNMNQKAIGRNSMAGCSTNGSKFVITEEYPIELIANHKYTAASEEHVPAGAVLSKAFGFDVDSNVKLNKEIEFDVLPDRSVNISVYPVYDRYLFDITNSVDGKASGGAGELYKAVGFCVVISDSN